MTITRGGPVESEYSGLAFIRRRLTLLVPLMPMLLLACTRESATGQRVVELLIESDGDQLAFKPTQLSCPSGVQVRLTFRHAGKYVSFQHNWVLILPHTFDAIVKDAYNAGEKNGWLPPHDSRILAATPLCSRGQQATIEFTAPAPGDYPFICTNPGHAESMWGVLHVTPS